MKTYSIEVLFVPDDLNVKQLKQVGELSLIKEFSLYLFWEAVRDTLYRQHGETIVRIIDDSTKTVVYQGYSVDMYRWINDAKKVIEWNVTREQYFAENVDYEIQNC